MRKIVRVSDAILSAGIRIPTIPIVTDRCLKTSCNICGESQLLSQCSVYEKDDATQYRCKNKCQVILTVHKADSTFSFPGNAYRLKDYVIDPKNDLFIELLNGTSIMFPR